MSNYSARAINPTTKQLEPVSVIDKESHYSLVFDDGTTVDLCQPKFNNDQFKPFVEGLAAVGGEARA